MNNVNKVIFSLIAIIAYNAYALTPAETNLVESIKKGVDFLVEQNPQGWKVEAHKLIDELEKSAPSEGIKQQTQVAPPIAMQKGTPPPPPSPMKKGGTPPPPPGPMVKGAVKKPAGTVVGVQKTPEKPKEQIFSKPKLSLLSDEKLLELYTGLLNDLPRHWNGQAVEKVEEKTKYGSKVYNVYGAPTPKWTNDTNTLKGVLIDKKIKTKETVEKEIAERITAVRTEKTTRPVAAKEEEKPTEELTEQDIEKLIKRLLENPKTTELSWVVSTKGNIKALFKLNPMLARQYEDKFIAMTGEKKFLPTAPQVTSPNIVVTE